MKRTMVTYSLWVSNWNWCVYTNQEVFSLQYDLLYKILETNVQLVKELGNVSSYKGTLCHHQKIFFSSFSFFVKIRLINSKNSFYIEKFKKKCYL